jgi:superfamily II DNA/RNA helicase
MREKKKERLAEIKRKRKQRERDSDDERDDAQKKKQKMDREKQQRQQQALNLNLPLPNWNALPLSFTKCLWNGPPGETEVSEELKQLRKSLGVLVKGQTALCPAPIQHINDTHLPELFSKYFTLKGIDQPTVVQKQCWPALLAGANVLGIAPTGSGKTLAYALPAIHHINSQSVKMTNNRVQPSVLILVPTRELAIQVQAVLKGFKGLAKVNAGILYGGQDKEQQVDALRSAGNALKVLVATPGRLIDLLGSRDQPLDLTKVTYQVIDEADRMLSLGFSEQLDAIAKQLRPGRQVVLFSATFPGRLRDLSEQWAPESAIIRCNTMEVNDHQKDKSSASAALANVTSNVAAVAEEDSAAVKCKKSSAKEVSQEAAANLVDSASASASPEPLSDSADADHAAATTAASSFNKSSITVSSTIKQMIHVCAAHKRPRLLIKFVERIRAQEKAEKKRQADPMIIFCNKIKTLKFVVSFLNKQKYPAVPLHGQLPQQTREENLQNFRSVSCIHF